MDVLVAWLLHNDGKTARQGVGGRDREDEVS